MVLLRSSILAVLAILIGTTAASAQTKLPPETKNAALRYWMAFAELQDTSADKDIANLLEKTISGEAAWDEAKLGPIVDANIESIEIMQRATKLPECDWGLEYSLGPTASVPYAKNAARSLARLNALYGVRFAAKGETPKALDTWFAGIRLSQDLAKGGSVFPTLVATAALFANLQTLTKFVKTGTLNATQRNQVAAAVRALPESGFDWGQAMWYEEVAADILAKELAQAANPADNYQHWFGTPLPRRFAPPSAADITAFHKWMAAVQAALRLPPEQAREKLAALQKSEGTLHPLFQAAIPSLERINDTRLQVQAERRNLVQGLSSK